MVSATSTEGTSWDYLKDGKYGRGRRLSWYEGLADYDSEPESDNKSEAGSVHVAELIEEQARLILLGMFVFPVDTRIFQFESQDMHRCIVHLRHPRRFLTGARGVRQFLLMRRGRIFSGPRECYIGVRHPEMSWTWIYFYFGVTHSIAILFGAWIRAWRAEARENALGGKVRGTEVEQVVGLFVRLFGLLFKRYLDSVPNNTRRKGWEVRHVDYPRIHAMKVIFGSSALECEHFIYRSKSNIIGTLLLQRVHQPPRLPANQPNSANAFQVSSFCCASHLSTSLIEIKCVAHFVIRVFHIPVARRFEGGLKFPNRVNAGSQGARLRIINFGILCHAAIPDVDFPLQFCRYCEKY